MSPQEFDICIVGTGPSSLAVVIGLLNRAPNTRILVLEAGQEPFSKSRLADRESSEQPFKLSPTVNIGYGGTSQLWHNVLAPLDESDFAATHLDADGDWLISGPVLRQHYQNVAAFFNFDFQIFSRPEVYFDYAQHLSEIEFDRNVFEPKVFVHPSRYLRADRVFKRLEKEHSSLAIVLGAEVHRYEERGGEVVVRYRAVDGNADVAVSCGRLVLCAGALNNPLIIQNSSVDGNLPMLGRCLMDHPMGNMFQFKYPEKKYAPLFSAIQVSNGIKAKVALRLTDRYRERYQLPNSAFYLRPAFAEGPGDATERLKLDLLTVRKKLMRGRLPVREGIGLLSNVNMVRQVLQYKTGISSGHRLSECMLVTEQLPDVRSHIQTVGNDGDNSKVSVKWRVSERDLEHVEVLGDLIEKYVVEPNGASLTYQRGLVSWKERLASAAHHLGTVRMSRNSALGCVNSDLRLHNSNAVFVCDGSVFPTSGNANPTLTCMALGDRLSEHLSNE